jgi:nucleotide-binding universal stress UspA family protein
VVIVRDAHPFERWARGEEPLQVTVGVDPSRTSRAALAWTARLSDAAATRTSIVHVASPGWEALRLGLHDAPHDHLTPEGEAVVRRDLARWLGDASPGLAGAETSIVAGDEPVEALLASSAAGSGLLVVGNHRRAAVARMWLGSVSRGTLTVAETNVALVPAAEPELGAEPVRAPRQLLVPCDFSPASLRALAHAQALAPAGGSVRLLHVVTPVGAPEGTDDEIRSRLERLVAAGARAAATTTVEVVHARTVSDGIWHAAERIAADLICMPSRDRVRIFSPKGPGSTVRSVIARCSCPVLLTPPERDE